MDLEQSAIKRAITDTKSAHKTVKFIWVGDGVAGVAVGTWLASIASTNAPAWELVIRSVLGFLIGLTIALLLVLAFNMIVSPYKQRNEAWKLLLDKPKPTKLPNRGDLIKALVDLKEAAVKYIPLKLRRRVVENSRGGVFTVDVELNGMCEKAQDKYQRTLIELDKQRYIAGKAFEEPIFTLTAVIVLLEARMNLPGNDLEKIRNEDLTKVIEARFEKAIVQIDEISQPSSDEEQYQ